MTPVLALPSRRDRSWFREEPGRALEVAFDLEVTQQGSSSGIIPGMCQRPDQACENACHFAS